MNPESHTDLYEIPDSHTDLMLGKPVQDDWDKQPVYCCIHHHIKMRYCSSFIPLKILHHNLKVCSEYRIGQPWRCIVNVLSARGVLCSQYVWFSYFLHWVWVSWVLFVGFLLCGWVFYFFFINKAYTFIKENIYLKGYLSCFRLYVGAKLHVILQLTCVWMGLGGGKAHWICLLITASGFAF